MQYVILFVPYEFLPDLVLFSGSMDLTIVYAIAAGCIFVTLFLMHVTSSLISLTSIIYMTTSKHLTYPYLLNSHQILDPWTCAIQGLAALLCGSSRSLREGSSGRVEKY